MIRRFAILFCLLLGVIASRAENFDVYTFDSPEQQARFDALTEELRCPKCQNNNLADSNAPIARDLRQRVYELIKAGKSDEEILAYLKARYGDFITYKPPLNTVTLLLWTGPFLLLGGIVAAFLWRLRRRPPSTVAAVPDPARVRDILARYDADAGTEQTKPEKREERR